MVGSKQSLKNCYNTSMSLLHQCCTEIEPLNMNGELFYLKMQFVPRSEHFTIILILCKEKSLFVLR